MSKFFDEDNLDEDSNRIIELISEGRLDEAEAGAKKLMIDYPEVHDGLERLAMVYESRGDFNNAIEMYQKALSFVASSSNHGEDLDEFLNFYKTKIKELSQK
ncbi:MAG: zinc chelation protein SecC [bacterium]